MSDSIIKVHNLSRRFGQQLALSEVNLTLQPGYVYGLVGANGAGKTTLIKHLLGLYQAQTGWVRVFDKDPVYDPVDVLSQIGFLSEDREMPEWMRVDELLRHTAAFYPNWDWNYSLELLTSFGVDGRKKISQLSRGGKAQVGLITAVAHRPKLLLLDEPSSGLDPLVRKDILNAIVKVVSDEGRTVIFSSHLLDEIEMMSDYLLMMHQGQLVMFGELDGIKERHFAVSARWPAHVTEPRLPEARSVERIGNDWWLVLEGSEERIRQSVTDSGGEILSSRNASLQEIFTSQARLKNEAAQPSLTLQGNGGRR